MKKIITLLSFVLLVSFSNAQIVFQSNFQNWAGGTPTDWFGSASNIANPSVLQWFTGSSYGTYLCGLVNGSTTTGVRFSTQNVAVVAGSKYKLELFVESYQGDMAFGYYDVTNSTYGPVSAYTSISSGATGILIIDSLTVPPTCTSAQLVIYVKNTATIGISGRYGVSLDRVTMTFVHGPSTTPTSSYQPKTIYEIQHTTAASGDSPYEDSLVETTGIVTATYRNGYWIQDSVKAWNGIYVFDNTNTPAKGDKITVRAEVDEYFNLTELKNVDTVITVSTGNTLPTPLAINTTDLSMEEKYEGVLCKVSGATCVDPSAGNGEWKILSTSDTALVDDLIYAYTPIMSSVYDVTGVVHYSFSNYKIEPRDSADIVRISSVSLQKNEELSFDLFPNPTSDLISLIGKNLETAEIFTIAGKKVKDISLNTLNVIDVSDLESGVYVIRVISEGKSAISRFIKE